MKNKKRPIAILLAFAAGFLVAQFDSDTRSVDEIADELRKRVGSRWYRAGGYAMTDFVADIPKRKLPLVAKKLRPEIDLATEPSIASELLLRWAAFDYEAALQFAESLQHRTARIKSIEAVVDTWVRKDLEGATAYVFSHSDEQLKRWASRGIVAEMARRDPAKALAFAQENKLLQRRYSSTLPIIFNVWIRTDPETAIREAKKITPMYSRNQGLSGIQSLIARWHPDTIKEKLGTLLEEGDETVKRAFQTAIADTDMDLALEYADSLDEDARLGMHAGIASRWAERKIGRVVELVMAMPEGSTKEGSLRRISTEWTRHDPQAATDYALKLDPSRFRNGLLGLMAGTWADFYPEDAMEWIKSLPAGQGLAAALPQVVTKVSETRPAAAAKWLNELPSTASDSDAYGLVAWHWLEVDSAAAKKWLSGLSESHQNRAAETIFRRWRPDDFGEAAELLLTMPESAQVRNYREVISFWNHRDPGLATRWALRLPREKEMQAGVRLGILGWARKDPVAAANFLTNHKPNEISAEPWNYVALEWGKRDHQAAHTWLQQLSPGEHRDKFRIGLIEGTAADQPAIGTAIVEAMEPGPLRDSAIQRLVRDWYLADAPKAAQWIAKLPEGDARYTAMYKTIRQWVKVDLKAVAEFLPTLTAGRTRHQAVREFVDAATGEDPELASRWVTELVRSRSDHSRIERIAINWLPKDRAAAEKWLRSTPLAKDRIESLLAGSK